MALLPHSVFIYGIASGAFSAFVLIFAVLALIARTRTPASARPHADGHLAWAEEEFESIAAHRPPPPAPEREFDDTLFRAEMVMEARRLIMEATGEAPKANVEEALAHGLDLTATSGLRRRLSSHLEQLEMRSSRLEKVSRIKQLRILVEAEEIPSPLAGGPPQLEWQGQR